MFNELLESTITKGNTNKNWTVALSSIFQIVILGALVLIPLIHTEALPKAMLSVLLVAPPPPPPPPPPQTVRAAVRQGIRQIPPEALHQPSGIPPHVLILTEEPLPPPDVSNNAPTSGPFDNSGQGIIAGNRAAVAPPPKTTAPTRIKQGGVVTAAALLSQTKPVYPALARMAHIQGDVVLHAIIDKNGKVAQLEVISGHPLLVQAALDAVKQWLYKPTLLNGEPVEVDTTITVTFKMAG